MDSDLHRKFFILLTFLVTIELYAVTIVTLEKHSPPRSITTQLSTTHTQYQILGNYS